jgi:hypothetical protein
LQLRISVTDNGPGISEEDQTKLFRPFSKLQTHRALNPNGSGLGLHICKLISQILDGDIEVKSEVGVFTTFTFWITVKDPDECNADLDLVPSHRSGTEIHLMVTPELNSIDTINRQQFEINSKYIDELLGPKFKLKIICADDEFFSLEAFRIVFKQLGVEKYVSFVQNGQHIIDNYKRSVEKFSSSQNEK